MLVKHTEPEEVGPVTIEAELVGIDAMADGTMQIALRHACFGSDFHEERGNWHHLVISQQPNRVKWRITLEPVGIVEE